MTAEHNHPPRCCCDPACNTILAGDSCEDHTCPACTEHGELAPTVTCPQCHQPAGRPHTEYCTLAPDRVWADLGSGPGYPAGDPPPMYGAECLARKTLGATPHTCLLMPGHEGDHTWTADR